MNKFAQESSALTHQVISAPVKSGTESALPFIFSGHLNLFTNESERQFYRSLPNHYQQLSESLSQNLNPLLANIIINQSTLTTTPELIYTNDQVACFSDDQLVKFKIINVSAAFFEYFQANPDPLQQNSLKCAVNEANGVTLKVDPARGTVSIIMPTSSLAGQNINLGLNNEAIYPTNPALSNSTAYQLAYNQSTSQGVANISGLGSFINTTSTPYGSLMNGFNGGNQSPLTRSYTYWQTDFPAPMTSAVLGDTAPMVGSWGNSVAYAGLQYGSNLLLRPGYFFTATPIVSGSVASPSTAEVLLNGGPVKTTDLAPGPFNLYNLPILNGDGTITVNLKNPDGNTYQTVNLPYYSSPLVLKDTTYLYQYNLGLPRGTSGDGLNMGYQSDTPGFSTQHFIALTNQYTMEIHGETQLGNFSNLGLSHDVTWMNAFTTSVSTAAATSESGNGYLLGFGLSRQTTLPNSFGFAYSISAQSSDFQMFGQQNGLGQQIQQTAFVNYLAPFGLSVATGYVNNFSEANGTVSLYNTSISWQFLPNFILTSSTFISNGGGVQNLGTNLGLNIILGSSQSISTNFSYSDSGGAASTLSNVNYQYLAPSNLWGANLTAGYATGGAGDSTPTSLASNGYYMFKNFNLNGQTAYVDSDNYSYGANLAGNMVLSSNGVSMGQYSTLSFIVVRVGHLANVGIKQNGSIIGTTDRNGSFVIPNVTPYLSQDIEINTLDLPFNTEVDSIQKRVVAPLNGGTTVIFTPLSFIPAFVKLVYNNDQIPPTGYEAKLYNHDGHQLIETDFIIDGGSVQLAKFGSELDYDLEFTVKDGTFSCPITKANIQADSNQYLYNLGNVKCVKK